MRVHSVELSGVTYQDGPEQDMFAHIQAAQWPCDSLSAHFCSGNGRGAWGMVEFRLTGLCVNVALEVDTLEEARQLFLALAYVEKKPEAECTKLYRTLALACGQLNVDAVQPLPETETPAG